MVQPASVTAVSVTHQGQAAKAVIVLFKNKWGQMQRVEKGRGHPVKNLLCKVWSLLCNAEGKRGSFMAIICNGECRWWTQTEGDRQDNKNFT